MGEMDVLAEALYGASTQRAVLNFPVSGQRIPLPVIYAYGLVKRAAAEANAELGLLAEAKAKVITHAAQEVAEGKLDEHFVLDVYQTGSGTSTNMNVNEVIANRACQLLGRPIGDRTAVHPNDDVNLGQSSNDTFPTALHMAAAGQIRQVLVPVLQALQHTLEAKAEAFWPVIKIGRTHLMDATPVRLGQEFKGYARQVELAQSRLNQAVGALLELPLGGTAVGTGLNRHPRFPGLAIARLQAWTGLAFRPASDPFEAQSAKDALVEVSGQLKTVAVSLFKIANDIRWLGSGPQCALGEIQLPAVQPGSSIMPGKVNPVMAESLMQVCARVFGNDATVTWCAASGNLELNVMMPALGHALLESVDLLSSSVRLFDERCIRGLKANEERCQAFIEQSLALATGLNARIGYDKAAALVKESLVTGQTVRQVARQSLGELGITESELAQALDAERMCAPGWLGGGDF